MTLARLSSTSAFPMMVVIGVFSSCETMPRNSSFAAFAVLQLRKQMLRVAVQPRILDGESAAACDLARQILVSMVQAAAGTNHAKRHGTDDRPGARSGATMPERFGASRSIRRCASSLVICAGGARDLVIQALLAPFERSASPRWRGIDGCVQRGGQRRPS